MTREQDIRDQILGYVRHMEDKDYLLSLFNSVNRDALLKVVVELLGQDLPQCTDAALFVQDSGTIAPDSVKDQFRTDMVSAGVVAALEQNVFRRNHFVRDNAIYTLAKLGSVASVPALHRAFSRYRDSDPILLPNLVFELRWLGKKMWPLVEEMLSASHFSTRWATIRFLAEGCWPSHADDFDRYKASLQSLANESNALLVAEASYELKKLTCYNETRIVEKYEKRKLRKQVRKLQPATTFEQIRISFRNHLCRTGKEDYDITELERFISDTSS